MRLFAGIFSRQSDSDLLDPSKRPIFLEARSSQAFIISTVAVSVFVDIFLYAVIVPVIPFALHEQAGVSEDQRQYWVSVLLAAYGAALLVASPICGWVSDRLSSRMLPFLCGLALLAGATVCLCLGSTTTMLVVGRILQGASAAIVWTIGLSLCADTVGRKNIGWAMGFVSGAMSLSMLIAPVLGGVVFSQAGYYAVFAMCFGLIGVDAVMRLALIEKKTRKRWLGEVSRSNSTATTPGVRTPHVAGSGTATPKVPIAEEDLSKKSDSTSSSSNSDDNIKILSIDPGQAEKVLKRRFKLRLPPIITLLRSYRLLAALWGSLVQAILLTAFDSTIPLHVHLTFDWSSLAAGLLFLPLVIPSFAAPIFGAISDRYGPRWLTTVGFISACPFVVALRVITVNDIGHKILLCVLLFFIGLAFAIGFAPLMAEITYAVESKSRPTAKRAGLKLGKNGAYGQAYALFNIAFAAGCMIGPIWGGMLNETAGWGTETWTLGLLSALTAIPAALWIGGSIFDKTKRNWPPAEYDTQTNLPSNSNSNDTRLSTTV